MKFPKITWSFVDFASVKIPEFTLRVYLGITWGKWGIVLTKQTGPQLAKLTDGEETR